MGLDIYAGTLTRYYSHNWKTVVQQWAEENGYSFNRITPDGEPADNEEELAGSDLSRHFPAEPTALHSMAGGQRAALLHR